MPKNTKKTKNAKNTHVASRAFITKTEGQEYALVTKMFGNCRMECKCYDNKTRLGIIRNKMRKGKNNKIKLDDVVIVSLRDFQDNKADIIHVYTQEEIKRLLKLKQIPHYKKENETEDQDVFVFDRPQHHFSDIDSDSSSEDEVKQSLISKSRKKEESSSSEDSNDFNIDDI